MRVLKISTLVILLLLVPAAASLAGGVGGSPALPAQSLQQVPLLTYPALDLDELAEEDTWREEEGLPLRFAVAREVNITPGNSGKWETLPSGRRLWRLRVGCPEVLSLNLGFTGYRLPLGATLLIYSADKTGPVFQFNSSNNRSSFQLWTPVLLTSEMVVELEVGADDRAKVILELGRIGCGYRYFGEDSADKSGQCNVDVICSEGDDWREDIASVGVYSFGGSKVCTGVLVNNTAQDQRPLFLTANHCEVDDDNVGSVVVYWNYESPTCGQQGGGSLAEFSHGDTLLASSSTSDFALLELAEIPDPVFGVTYAGWDRSGDVPSSAVCIHHPRTDEKSISFDDDELTITTYLADVGPGDQTHLRVEAWDLGTTEGGSSGSPLFDPDHRIVGQLHGGHAACDIANPEVDNDRPDWYGRLSVSWNGNGTPKTRLSDYLDPSGTGVLALNRFGGSEPDPPPPGEMALSITSVGPNPFLDFTKVNYRLNQAGVVHAKVMNIRGYLVKDMGLYNGTQGENDNIAWNGTDGMGRPVAAGLYVFLLESAGKTARCQVVHLR